MTAWGIVTVRIPVWVRVALGDPPSAEAGAVLTEWAKGQRTHP